MNDNKYPLFSPELMQRNSFHKIAEGFRPSDPGELVSGSVGIDIEKMSKKIDPNNLYFSRVKKFAEENGLDLPFLKK